jgi:hypothetical protein
MTEPTLPTPDEVVNPSEAEDTDEGEKYQGGEIPRVESEETQNDN